MLEDIMVHEILRRFSSKNRALLCDKCRQYTNAVAQAEVPETMLFSLLLLIRRDSGRDFTTFWQGKEVILSCVEVMGYMVPRLRVGSASYVSSAIIMRHGCKAHSCWDRRSRLLQARLRSLPVGAGDADMLAYAKYFFSCGFGLDQEKEAVLDMHCVSEKRTKNAQDAAGCVEDLGRYFCYAKDETGTKQYLGVFAMMSLLQCFHLLSCQLFLMLRNAVETTFATSWGPAAAVIFVARPSSSQRLQPSRVDQRK